jgi:hypothetical protein
MQTWPQIEAMQKNRSGTFLVLKMGTRRGWGRQNAGERAETSFQRKNDLLSNKRHMEVKEKK